MVVSGHFGNYDIVSAALIARGFDFSALHRMMSNRLYNGRNKSTARKIGKSLFARGRKGLASMLGHLRGRGFLSLLTDRHMSRGTLLSFFGKSALTATSAADLALRHSSPLVPIYAIRQHDGLSFRTVMEPPNQQSDPKTMTQALNDSFKRQVRANTDQWLWSHRRWKGPSRLPSGGSVE